MRWLVVCLSVCTAVAAIELRCQHPNCSGEGLTSEDFGKAEFTVEGHVIEFLYKDIQADEIADRLDIDCGGWQALDSSAMPRFAAAFRVPLIYISNCPLPAGNGSLVAALATLNVVLEPVDGRLSLELLQFPADRLTSHHFLGLEDLTNLKINGNDAVNSQRPLPEAGFLAGLQKLRMLDISGVRLPSGEINRLPKSLNQLSLSGETLNTLPSTLPKTISEIVHSLPNLWSLVLIQSSTSDSDIPAVTTPESNNVEQPKSIRSLNRLQSIYVLSWKERRFVPFEQCNTLRTIKIEKSEVEELPDRWVAACPVVEKLKVDTAEKLTFLPAKLLEGATALKHLAIRMTRIRSLPAKFLEGAPNLIELDLSNNRIAVLPSDAFPGLSLQSLNLEGNKFPSESLASLAPLTSLTELRIDNNKLFYNLCDENGYSSLRNLKQLKILSVRETHVSQICRDWREDLVFLEILDVIGTNITELKGADFQYTRDATVEYAVIRMSTSVNSVVFTKTDYENTVNKTKPGVAYKLESYWIYPDRRINCNCDTYWLRRLIEANHEITVDGLRCTNDQHFDDVTPEEMCSENELTGP